MSASFDRLTMTESGERLIMVLPGASMDDDIYVVLGCGWGLIVAVILMLVIS